MRFLRFLGRQWLFWTAFCLVLLSPDAHPVAWILLAWAAGMGWYHRYRLDRCRADLDALRRGVRGSRLLALGLVALVAAGGIALAHPAPAHAALAPPAIAPSVVAPAAPPAAPAGLAPPSGIGFNPWDWIIGHYVAGPLRSAAKAQVRSALQLSKASMLTPDLTSESRVTQIWQLTLEIADALLLLLVIVGAVMVVAGDWTYLEAKALAPRVVVAGVAMNLSLVIAGQAITWSNALVLGFLSFGDSSVSSGFADAVSATHAPLLMALLLVVVTLLVVANVLRLVVVVVMVVGAPLLNVFGVLPATDGIARVWWRALAACLIAPGVQALLMVLAVWLAASSNSPILGISPGESGQLLDTVLIVVVVALMAISPLWMLKRALGQGHGYLGRALRWGRVAAGAAT